MTRPPGLERRLAPVDEERGAGCVSCEAELPDPPHPPTEPVANAPSADDVFADPRQRDAMLTAVLDALLRQGAMDRDGVMRAVLTIEDLVGLVPPGQQREHSAAMVDALVAYLDGEWDARVFAKALDGWRSSTDAARRSLQWTELPPVVRRLAELYAEVLLRYAHDRGWVGRLELQDRTMWKLQPAGGDALRHLRATLSGG